MRKNQRSQESQFPGSLNRYTFVSYQKVPCGEVSIALLVSRCLQSISNTLLFCEGCQMNTGFNLKWFYFTPWKSSQARKNTLHSGSTLCAPGGRGVAFPAQRSGLHAHVRFYDCETEPCMPNAIASYSISHLTDVLSSHRRGQRTVL